MRGRKVDLRLIGEHLIVQVTLIVCEDVCDCLFFGEHLHVFLLFKAEKEEFEDLGRGKISFESDWGSELHYKS